LTFAGEEVETLSRMFPECKLPQSGMIQDLKNRDV